MSSFNAVYIASTVSALVSAYLMDIGTPGLSPVIKFFLIPMAVAYVVMRAVSWAFPRLNKTGRRISTYVENRTLGEIDSMNYVQIFPPLMLALIIFMIVLYGNR